MSDIVGLISLSHSPFWDPSADVEEAGSAFVAGVLRARTLLAELRPTALIIFGPDHFRSFFYDVLPQFCIGVEAVLGFGDYGSPRGDLPLASALAKEIFQGVTSAGFDPAYSLRMVVDHGISQPYAAIAPSLAIPIVPIMVNASGAPRPSLQRCFEFGKAVGSAISRSDGSERIVVVGSGGLSHSVTSMSVDAADITADMRDYVITGRSRAAENSAAREASLRERKGSIRGPVNADWDRWLLGKMRDGDLSAILALSNDEIERVAGNGAHEIRAWLAALGAWGKPIEIFAYEPVPEWVTGMACIVGV